MRGPTLNIAGCVAAWIAGILLAQLTGPWWLWLCIAIIATGCFAWRNHFFIAAIAITTVSAAWTLVHTDRLAANDLAHYITETPQLVRIEGVIEREGLLSSPWRGAMGMYGYQRSPNTLAVLRVERVADEPISGRLLMMVREPDFNLTVGKRIEATGWLSQVRAAMNPGELDFHQRLNEQGIAGRLTLSRSENWRTLGETSSHNLRALHLRLGAAAENALNLGLDDDPVRLGLLQTMLLGRWSRNLDGVDDTFRRVGLAHLLSISGAHLGILLGLIWLVCRMLLVRPPHAAMTVLAILVLFMLVVPIRVPIARAGIMAAVLCITVWLGRKVDAHRSLAIAALLVLIWRPSELFSSGFQLSFLVVAALLQFTEPMLERVWPSAWIGHEQADPRLRICRWIVGYFVASAIAFTVALPIVAFHYRMISPHAILLSVLALPVLTAMLAAGYIKIILGMISPTLSHALAGPLRWFTDMMLALVDEAHTWPGATIQLTGEPNAAWSLGLLALVWATFAGYFKARSRAAIAAALIMLGWTLYLQLPTRHTLELHALAVGNGSCMVVRTPTQTLMFDCGSQQYFDVALRSVNPALPRLGIKRIDTLIISHADIDHFAGVPDVADAFEIGRVWVTPQMINAAKAEPTKATAHLLNELARRNIPIETITQGHRAQLGEVELDVLWPPADFTPARENDASIVLSLQTDTQRILLCGDIEQQPIERLLESNTNLRADVLELPHHGSHVDATGPLLDAVQPTIVLQSCSHARMRNDEWRDILEGRKITRYVTDRHGSIHLSLDQNNDFAIKTFQSPTE